MGGTEYKIQMETKWWLLGSTRNFVHWCVLQLPQHPLTLQCLYCFYFDCISSISVVMILACSKFLPCICRHNMFIWTGFFLVCLQLEAVSLAPDKVPMSAHIKIIMLKWTGPNFRVLITWCVLYIS